MKTIKNVLCAVALVAFATLSAKAEPLTSPKQSGNTPAVTSSQTDADTVHGGQNFTGEAARQKAMGNPVATTQSSGNTLACESQTGKHSIVKDCCKSGSCHAMK